MKRHIWALPQVLDTFKTVPPALPVDAPLTIRFSRFRRGDYPDPIATETEGYEISTIPLDKKIYVDNIDLGFET